MNRKPADPRKQAQRAALNALHKARRLAERAGVELSEWEGEFLGSVEGRVRSFGRAFADPEKGARDQALSARQTLKLKEIAAKAKGEPRRWRRRGKAAPASE
jgi:hypothetical protein